jgi:hypothetical protein
MAIAASNNNRDGDFIRSKQAIMETAATGIGPPARLAQRPPCAASGILPWAIRRNRRRESDAPAGRRLYVRKIGENPCDYWPS